MGDYLARGKKLEKKGDEKLKGWSFFGQIKKQQEHAAKCYELAADSYKLAQSWDEAGPAYLKLANCFLKLGYKHEAANAYVEAGQAYQKTLHKQAALPCLEESINCYLKIGRFDKAVIYSYELGLIYEIEHDLDRSYAWFEKAAHLLQAMDAPCKC